ncbi:MAG: DUF3108 domain-containing protein [Alphaproteobacteria bacterium]|jgi:hypothetical protein|nr:DUF3108 domain-containing protein [Alphaproteobacteria bacterium]
MRRMMLWAGVTALLGAGSGPAMADEAQAAAIPAPAAGVGYSIALAGVPIGEARITAEIGESDYRLAYDLAFDVLVWRAEGRGEAVGRVAEGGLRPDSYRVAFSGRRDRQIRVDFSPDGTVRDYAVEPPFDVRRFGPRVAILPDQLQGVVDPLTALVVPDAAGTLDGAALCAPARAVFSGAARFDLAAEIAEGPADGRVTCAVSYAPVSGHRFQSDGVERLQAAPLPITLRHHPDIGAWLPERAIFPTGLGDLVIARKAGDS